MKICIKITPITKNNKERILFFSFKAFGNNSNNDICNISPDITLNIIPINKLFIRGGKNINAIKAPNNSDKEAIKV